MTTPTANPIADFPRMLAWQNEGALWSVYIEGAGYRIVLDGPDYRAVTTVDRDGLEAIVGMLQGILDQPAPSALVVPDVDLGTLTRGLPEIGGPAMNRAQRRAVK